MVLAGLRQTDVAKVAGCHQSLVSKVLRGMYPATSPTGKRIVAYIEGLAGEGK